MSTLRKSRELLDRWEGRHQVRASRNESTKTLGVRTKDRTPGRVPITAPSKITSVFTLRGTHGVNTQDQRFFQFHSCHFLVLLTSRSKQRLLRSRPEVSLQCLSMQRRYLSTVFLLFIVINTGFFPCLGFSSLLVYRYEGQEDGDLSFVEGDVIEVLDKVQCVGVTFVWFCL